MSRLIIVCVMFPLMILVSAYSLFMTMSVEDRISTMADELETAFFADDKEGVMFHSARIRDFWSEKEEHLRLFSRHSQIENLSQSVARLYPLAQQDDKSGLLSELEAMRWQMRNIMQSEAVNIWNIF